KPDLTILSAIGCIFSNFLALLDAGERDALTSLYNRRMFDTRLSSLVRSTVNEAHIEGERRARQPEPTNFLGIIDIDFFKRVNDDFGHLFGDEVLLWMARHMRQCFRNADSLFRYGGEEFAVLLTGLTQKQAQETFERFRTTIATNDFPQIGQITVSIGYSHIDRQANPTLVFGDADKALYYAKEHGRNRVFCYQQLLADNLLEADIQENVDIEIF
ncbi:MAG: GGDEF domain-containing protein, partial [Algicola sp.]|nr:GGDEF domain-containing protein [Algicola sp.]